MSLVGPDATSEEIRAAVESANDRSDEIGDLFGSIEMDLECADGAIFEYL
jgi:hypothetical protein